MLTAARALVRMPDLVGLQYSKAKLLCENAGLVLDHVVFTESYDARNTVLEQAPLRGQMIYTGDRVAVAVSRDSYVRWLPAIYQRSDLSGRNLVKELLWITQHLFSSVEDVLNVSHQFFDPFEAPEHFLPWLASWTAMVLEEDWPVAKKRRLIKRAVELYRIRGTLRGLKLFISLFTGHEPEVHENEWPFRGWRIGTTSSVGIDTIVLPPVNLAHTFIVEMPTAYQDLSPESVIRIHEIVRMEKPAHSQYYLRFAAEDREAELREFFAIGTRSGIGIGQEVLRSGAGEQDAVPSPAQTGEPAATMKMTAQMRAVDANNEFPPATRQRRRLLDAVRADDAPVEGREVRSSEEGFGASARAMPAITTGVGKTPTVSRDVVPAPDPTQEGVAPMSRSDGSGDTVENKITPVPNATIISSTSQRLADDIKPDQEPDIPGTGKSRGKKSDPKKTK